MNNFSPELFGRSFGEITMEYIHGFGRFIAPIFHIMVLIILILVIIRGNNGRKYFTIYFIINYLWLLIFVGLYISFLLYKKMGIAFLIYWGPVPFLLLFILLRWLKELKSQKNSLDFKNIPCYRYIVIPVILFGFWYPSYIWNFGFNFSAKDLLFSSFGLMPCPTTMVVLSILTLKFPDVNKGLFYSLTLFSVMIGTAQIAIGYVPDYPLAFLGYYSAFLILFYKVNQYRIKKSSA
jgi:hypothetical protein